MMLTYIEKRLLMRVQWVETCVLLYSLMKLFGSTTHDAPSHTKKTRPLISQKCAMHFDVCIHYACHCSRVYQATQPLVCQTRTALNTQLAKVHLPSSMAMMHGMVIHQAPDQDWMIWWMKSEISGTSERVTSFMATLRPMSMPKLMRASAGTSPTNWPASSSVWLRALGGTASLPSQGAMLRIVITASTASCHKHISQSIHALTGHLALISCLTLVVKVSTQHHSSHLSQTGLETHSQDPPTTSYCQMETT